MTETKFHKWGLVLASVLFMASGKAQKFQKPIWQSKEYSVFADRVVQDSFTGKALSATSLASDYESPANAFKNPRIDFKFSINGKDNEMPSGRDHHFNFVAANGAAETPLIRFGEQYNDSSKIPDNTFLAPNSKLRIRVDMRGVLADFEQKGFYITPKGDKIYKQDFKGVYVAGSSAPLIWDFDNVVNRPQLQLKDAAKDGIYEATVLLNAPEEKKRTAAAWTLSKDVSQFPQYNSEYPISDAVYNLALEEAQNAVEPDSTFRTGKEWAGVWTRDISYSIILSMAYLQPDVAKKSLMRKVNKRRRIIQDTGTGGAWPASTDRMIWAVAAWEIYKATGDEDWLKNAYSIIKNSIEDDLKVAYDLKTGLVKGESSFLDWREQTYPRWMQPVDIYESECLGTNAVHYQVNVVLSNMATLVGDKAATAKFKGIAARIKEGINTYLWMPERGYYAQYLYGRNTKIRSPRAEALGEALCVLFGIADAVKAKQVIENTPVMPFGIPCIYPQIPGIPPYHNNAVWPFVQSYYALAAAKTGNEKAVLQSISAVYRPAALFITNKENFVAGTGDFAGTQINSSNMLWSLSGNLALHYKVFFGIEFNVDGLAFHPFVPHTLSGKRSLTNFKYRNAVLDIEMKGCGNKIKTFLLDGKPARAVLPATIKGMHRIRIVLANNTIPDSRMNIVENYVSPETPTVAYVANKLSWREVAGAVKYEVLKNGTRLHETTATSVSVDRTRFAEYQTIAIDKNGCSSFASEPLLVADNITGIYEIEKYAAVSTLPYNGASGNGFVEVSKTVNTAIEVPVTIPQDGLYAIDIRYANGNGPVNTENKCAIRTLENNSSFLGVIVLPQRGKDEWSNWGWSNAVQATLKKGKQLLNLSFRPFNENMNGEVNQAMLDYIRIIQIR